MSKDWSASTGKAERHANRPYPPCWTAPCAASYATARFRAHASLTAEPPHCHTIGIGVGKGASRQVLVLVPHDMSGINLGKMPKFVRHFMQGADSIRAAIEAYVRAAKDGSFPDDALHAG